MWYDVLVLAILIFFTVRGAAKGMVWQLAGIVGIVLCFVFADAISAFAGPYVQLDPPLNNWVILFGAYIVFTFLAFLLAGRIEEYLTRVKLKEFDRHLGAVFGFAKGTILCLIMTFLVVTVSDDAREALKQSRSGIAAARIVKISHSYLHYLPDDLIVALEKYIHLLDEDGTAEQYADDHNHVHDNHYHGDNDGHGDHEGHDHGNDVLPGSQINLGVGSVLPSGNPPPTDLLSQFRGLVSEQTQQAVISALNQESNPQTRETLLKGLVKVFQNASPGDKSLFEQDFETRSRSGNRELLNYLSNAFKDPVSPPSTIPGSNPIVPAPSTVVRDEIAQLKKQIVSAYSTDPAGQHDFENRIEGFLGTLPEQVYLGVVKDWNADIWSLPDPDRQTTGQTSLEQRILRQLELNGIPLSRLEPAMRRQLEEARTPANGTQR